eukprot:286462-Pyramimonas_sp.AAC.1
MCTSLTDCTGTVLGLYWDCRRDAPHLCDRDNTDVAYAVKVKEPLLQDGLRLCGGDKTDFTYAVEVKEPLLYKAAETLLAGSSALKAELEAWIADEHVKAWLEPAALFATLCARKDLRGKNWYVARQSQ